MKFPHLILVSLFVLFLTGCSKDEPVTPTPETKEEPEPKPEEPEEPEEPQLETYFTFEASTFLDTSMNDDWIIVHNGNGDLLDYKSFENGETLLFQALDTVTIEKITVTRLQVRQNEFSLFHLLDSYGNIDTGRIWNYGPMSAPNSNPITPIGKFDLTVTNIPNWYEYNLKNSMNSGRFYPRRFHEGITGDTDPTNLVLTDFDLFEDNDLFLSIIDENRYPKYTWLNDVQDGDEITIDGSVELKDFDDTIDIELPADVKDYYYTLSTFNQATNNGFFLYWFGLGTPLPASNSLRMGYLDLYSEYTSQVSYIFDDYSYYYSEKSDRITVANINPVKPVFTINDESYSNFSFETDTDHIIHNSIWSSSTFDDNFSKSASWGIRASKDFFPKFNEMPEDFATMYPDLNFDTLEYSQTNLNIQTWDWETSKASIFRDKGDVIAPAIQESITIKKK